MYLSGGLTDVPVTLFGANLNGKATGVSSSVSGAALSTDGAETDRGPSSVSDLAKELGTRKVGHVVSNSEGAMSTSTLGMDDALRDPFSIELCEICHEVSNPYLKKNRS